MAIVHMKLLAKYKILFIEEPTSPHYIRCHKTIREALEPCGIRVATGEHCQNMVIWKQFLQEKAIDYAQIDVCRLAGFNEVLPVLLMAKKCCTFTGLTDEIDLGYLSYPTLA